MISHLSSFDALHCVQFLGECYRLIEIALTTSGRENESLYFRATAVAPGGGDDDDDAAVMAAEVW